MLLLLQLADKYTIYPTDSAAISVRFEKYMKFNKEDAMIKADEENKAKMLWMSVKTGNGSL